jgi:hypothetical protein
VEHIWSVLCKLSLTDQKRNNISLIEVLESVTFTIPSFPDDKSAAIGIPLGAELVSFWERTDPDIPETSAARVLILGPNEEILNDAGFEYVVNLKEVRRMRIMGEYQAFPYVGDGTYRIVVQQQQEEAWVQVASIPLEIALREQQDSSEPAF